MKPTRFGPLRRYGAGLFALVALSLAILPLAVHVAAAHRSHWFGPSSAEVWSTLLVPWAARLHCGLALLAVAGWSAFATPAQPRGAPRLRVGLTLGLLGALAVALAAVPPWIWLTRLGLVAWTQATVSWALSAGVAVLAGAGAGAMGARWPGPGAASVGMAAGAGLLALSWSAFQWTP
jgi:hypothetical protein